MRKKNKQVSSAGSLLAHFESIRDPRVERTRVHLLEEILLIGLSTLLSGGETFNDMEEFGKAKESWLRGFLKLPGGIPSHDTFNRVFSAIDPQEFTECFMRWTKQLRREVSEEIVAVDGKALRRARRAERSPVYIVSAWALENSLVLGQVKVDDKSNEITAVPELLRALQLKGCLVTLDAMGCQKEIAKQLVQREANYLLALKGNQQTVHEEFADFLQDGIARQQRTAPAAGWQFLETVEKDHGRIETRRYWQSDRIDWFEDLDQWAALQSVGMVESTRQLREELTVETRYYLSSLPLDVERFARGVRGHWSIENSLHWTLDVQFAEDDSRARNHDAAQNLALLRRLALNLINQENSDKRRSNRRKRKKAGWDNDYLLKLLKI